MLRSRSVDAGPGTINDMVDVLAALSVVVFIALGLGYVWLLERV